MRKLNPYWFFTFSALLILIVPQIFRYGMFSDGLVYGSIARNLSLGIGTLWEPHLSKVFLPVFHGHPPFAFFTQSVFFRVFGDHFWVEGIYGLFIGILSCWGISSSWSILSSTNTRHSFLPVLLWVFTPIVFWGLANNLLENTLSLLTIWSIFWLLLAVKKEMPLFGFLAGIFVLLACLTKGPVGLFPLIVPFVYGLIYSPNKSLIIKLSSLMVLGFVGGFVLLVCFDSGFGVYLQNYIKIQLTPSLSNFISESFLTRLTIIPGLLGEILFPLLCVIIPSFFYRKLDFSDTRKKDAVFFVLIGFSASLPLVISSKVSHFYLIPSIPFFIISLSLLIEPYFEEISQRYSSGLPKAVMGLTIVLFLITVGFTFQNYGEYKRDKKMIKEVEILGGFLPKGTILGASESVLGKYSFSSYLSRKAYISLDKIRNNKYVLFKKEDNPSSEIFLTLDVGLADYRLCKRK